MKRDKLCIAALVFALTGAVSAVAADDVRYSPDTPAFTPQLPELRFVAVPDQYLKDFEGNRFSYMDVGPRNAPVILLVHGIGANSFHWRYQYEALKDTYRVVAWNAPGFVLTDNLKAESPTCVDMARALAAFTDAMGLKRTYVYGNSFGSAVSQCYAMNYPDRVIKLALSGVNPGRGAQPAEMKAKTVKERETNIAGGGMTLMKAGREDVLLGHKTPAYIRPMVQSMLAATHPKGYLQATRFGLDMAPTYETPERFTMPLLMIMGDEDRIAPKGGAEQLHKAVKGSRLEILEGYGHLPELEAPEKVNALLRDFFK